MRDKARHTSSFAQGDFCEQGSSISTDRHAEPPSDRQPTGAVPQLLPRIRNAEGRETLHESLKKNPDLAKVASGDGLQTPVPNRNNPVSDTALSRPALEPVPNQLDRGRVAPLGAVKAGLHLVG